MRKVSRLAVCAGVLSTAASLALPGVATAAPSNTGGSVDACIQYLEDQGYSVTEKMVEGCEAAVDASVIDACYDILTFDAGIPNKLAIEACYRAASPEW